MAIAHLATEYVFSDFLLKEPAGPQFQGLRLELAADKVLTCVAVGLPLLLISLAFAQEISAPRSAASRPAPSPGARPPSWMPTAGPASGKWTPASRCGCTSPCELSERQFHYPIVEQFLRSKRGARGLVATYLGCRLLSLVALAAACAYLAFYLGFAASSDEFACSVRSGVLANDSSVPPRFQCKLVAVGVFRLLGGLQLAVYLALLPAAAYALCLPLRGRARVLRAYQLLPSVDVQALTARRFDDLSLYLLFLEENAGELKSYRCLSVLQHLQSTPGADPLLLLACLGLVRTDALDGRPRHPHGPATELTDLAASSDKQTNHEDKSARQRLLNSS
ncbi:pannexin-1 isoform X2 [Erinaceus europaeus]|uniref:Pannexin-1 isoform X2 n=1 Tax=Erinaceus europaeus TaxID=9365 RepID=A0ABM3WGJ1_ERIEU|nr:pannexin-1 isoform X2 [Erinaceus europaeus]